MTSAGSSPVRQVPPLPAVARRVSQPLPASMLTLLVAALAASTVRAGEEVAFDLDDPPDTRYRLTKTLSIGADATLDLQHQRNFDLSLGQDPAQRGRLTSLEPEISLAIAFEPNDQIRAFADVSLARTFQDTSVTGYSTLETELRIEKAYVTLHDLAEGLTLMLGRQPFEDETEWFFDVDILGARAIYRVGPAALEASFSASGWLDQDLLNKDDVERVNNYLLTGHYALNEDTLASAYILIRDDFEEEPEDLRFFGLQVTGELTPEIEYWVNAAYAAGDAFDGNGFRGVSGFGVDVVATYAPKLPLEPSLTLGYAFGSGDNDGSDVVDDSFRQTGLQDNDAEFNGVTRFKYYGRVLDPELSNLQILTLGAGLKPSERSSIDLVYHHYRQHRPADFLRDSNLSVEPTGSSRNLGHGLDLVVGYQDENTLSAGMVLGAFFPGKAFPNHAKTAYFAGLEFSIQF